jgi:hypothetical protein
MVTNYHKQIENTLFSLGCEWKAQRKIKKVCRGNELPLSIVDPRSKYVVNYQPDVYYVLRNNKKLIIEVLDSEAEKQDSIIADVICSFLVENVEGILFIYPEKPIETTILEALVTIYRGVVRKGIKEDELPDYRKSGAYLIPREEINDNSKIMERLSNYAREDKWFKSRSHTKNHSVAS